MLSSASSSWFRKLPNIRENMNTSEKYSGSKPRRHWGGNYREAWRPTWRITADKHAHNSFWINAVEYRIMSGVTEEAVLCMQHCSNQKNIFFTKFPEICPLCGQSLKSCSLIIPPFRIPSPFVAQNNVAGVLLVKPTKGSFLR